MKNIHQLISLFFFFLAVSITVAQTGKIAGTVIDGEFSEPMAFANILVKGTTQGTTSDFDGKYEIDLEPGTYTLVFSFVGYTTVEVSDIVVVANQVETLDVTLATNTLEQVVITTSVKRNTENSVLEFQKNSTTLLDGLSAQSIQKTGAGDVAAAVKNVPGVSVEGGKYVYVRGLGDRYTKSILNGVDIPGLDPDRNTIQMDIFPTNILDNIIVVKAASAEYPADFTGGVVDIVTKDFPTRKEATISVGLAYNPDMHFNDKYLTYTGSDTDWFGYDDGTRNLPINRYQRIPGTFENKLLLNTLTNRFQKELAAKQDNSGMNFDIGFTLGNQYEIGEDNRLGYQASFSYKNQTQFFENRIDGASLLDPDTSIFEPNFTLASTGDEGINTVLITAMGGLAYKTERSKYKLNVLHIQNGESTAGFFNQVISQDGAGGALEPLVKHALTFTERSVTNVLLNGKHRLSDADDPWNLDWKFSPTFSKVYDLNHRVTPFQISGEGDFFISPSASTFPIQLWRWLNEESWVGKVDFDKKHELFGRPAKFKVGSAYTYKFRDFSIDDYTFTITGDDSFIRSGNADALLAEENLWVPDQDETSSHPGEGTHLVFGDQFNPNDAYEGQSDLFAMYVSSEFNLTEDFKAIIGLRTELFQLYYTGQDGDIIYDEFQTLDEFDFFPSANLIYALSENANLRGSYSRTTARPSFKEKSASQIFDPITNRLFIGNLDLVPTYINNFDVRYERFGENGQMIAGSVFYKSFRDPIELTFFLSAPTQVTPQNLGDAKVYGVEVEFRQRFGFLAASLENLKLNVNASLIKSELTMADQEFIRRQNAARPGQTIERERDLQGQSPYLINVGLDYAFDDIGFQAGLFYNVQGETLEVVGTGVVPDVFAQPFNSLNLTARKSFGENQNSSIDLKITNILGQDRFSEYEIFGAENTIFQFRTPGTEIALGYTYRF